MTTEKSDPPPDFLRELADDAAELASVPLDRLVEHLPAVSPPLALRDRLLSEVSELPLRYAPFFDRLGSLWDLPEGGVCAELERAKDPRFWRYTALPGIKLFDVDGGAAVAGARVRIVRLAPRVRLPRHEHLGDELLLVLEGSYTDTSGTLYQAGDRHEMQAGTEHGFVVGAEPCICSFVDRGRRFRSPFLRALSRIVGDD